MVTGFMIIHVTTGPNGSPIENAHIKISETNGKFLLESKTNANGITEIEICVPCSTVNVDISAPGFNSRHIKGVQIDKDILPVQLNPKGEKIFLTPALASILLMSRLNPKLDKTRFQITSSTISSTIWPPYPGVDLRLGMQGPSIRQVQERLNELGANPQLTPDGIFGSLTAGTVIAFQQANSLTPDGIVNLITWNTLFSREPAPRPIPPPASPVWPPYPGIDLRLGMQGPSIRQVQERLNELGANPQLTPDGIFGSLSAGTVIAFQKANGLTPDGIVNLITWNTLFSREPAPRPIPPPAPPVWPPYPGVDLLLGMQGPSIRQVQERLNELGANPQLTPDGIFGSLTAGTVIAFQQANDLTPDGIVNLITWNTLFSHEPAPRPIPPPAPPVWPPYPGVDLRLGMQGPSIRQVQERLNELGANPQLTPDGIFGLLTETTVIAFQRANGITPDGIVDLTTWNTLFSREPAPLPNRMIALTFDDGPVPLTDRLLDILERYNARATFFVTGQLVERGQNIVSRAANMGNEIAGHTWMHFDLRQLSDREIAESIQSTSAAIESITGFSPPIYRPPFGFTNANVQRVSGEIGYSIVNWTFDTLDWLYRDADIIYNIVMNNVINGDIILLHDIHVTTIDAMERVIPSLIAEGFQLVTVSELLAYKYGELEPGKVYGVPRIISY